MADNYKVTFRMCGSYHLFGYAETLEDAQEMAELLHNEGWLYRKIHRWDEQAFAWIEI